MAEGSKAEDRACSTLLHRLILRVPKATLDILGAYAEDLFRAIFGLELDCGKLWQKEITRNRCSKRLSSGGYHYSLARSPLRRPGSADSGGVRGGPLSGDFWSRIRLWTSQRTRVY